LTNWGLFKYVFKSEKSLFIIITFVLLVSGLIETVGLLFIAPIVDIITLVDTGESSRISNIVIDILLKIGLPTDLWFLFIMYISINIFFGVFATISIYLVQKIKYSFCSKLVSETITDIFNAKWFFFTSIKQGKLLNTLTRELQIVGDTLAGFGRLFATLMQTVIFIVVPFYVSWKVMSITIVIILIIYLPLMMLRSISERLGKMNTEAGNNFMSVLQESIGSVKIILGFGEQEKNKALIIKRFSKSVDAQIKTIVFETGLQNAVVAFATVGIATVFFVSRHFGIPLSEIAIIFISFMKISGKVGQVIAQKAILDRSLPSLGQVNDIRLKANNLKQRSGEIVFNRLKDGLLISDLTFNYPGSNIGVKNISLEVPKGKMIAIVGESGSGKSTLIDLIMGFNDPDSGSIFLDDVPLQKYDINTFRKKLGYVPQESILFNMTIADNIGWSKANVSMSEIKNACESANASKFIESFSDNYNTLVGDRGVRLSGGQIQRIALARAIIRKPEILILDEATSALDTKSEKLIQQSVEKISTNSTVIVIAHRLSTIKEADRIYVLDQGEIVESGNYSKLINNNNLFNQMVKSQEFS
jgi:ABC-type multidrug transport system fused ATPase/permease subunit